MLKTSRIILVISALIMALSSCENPAQSSSDTKSPSDTPPSNYVSDDV